MPRSVRTSLPFMALVIARAPALHAAARTLRRGGNNGIPYRVTIQQAQTTAG